MRTLRKALLGSAVLLFGFAVGAQAAGYGNSGGYGNSASSSQSQTSSHSSATKKVIKAAEANGSYVFSPKKKTVKVGTKIVWQNPTDAPHTVTSDKSSWKFDKQLSQGKTLSFVFKKAGTYKYHCSFHPGMVGTIVVKP